MRLLMLGLAVMLVLAGCATDGGGRRQPDRVALVIGNGAYHHTAPLANPARDARMVAASLQQLGFQVIAGIDLDAQAMRTALDNFSTSLRGARTGLFYYAGHGVQVSGKNFLVPVDARFDDALISVHGLLESQTIMLGNVIREMDSEPRVNMVFLDACRNNPLVESIEPNQGKSKGRSLARVDRRGQQVELAQLQRGLAQVQSKTSHNMLIAFATQPGNIAEDGVGGNSPFTQALVSNIATPGIEVREMLTRVRKSVMHSTDNRQVPWDQASLTEQFFFLQKRQQSTPPP